MEKKRADAVKAQRNIIKAIEQGIITESTKTRLTELENLITQHDAEILKEQSRNYSYLTIEDIKTYLSKFVFENTADMKVRKLIVNTFIREIILYKDRLVITYNFTDNPKKVKLPGKHNLQTEKQIETALSVFFLPAGSFIFPLSAPQKIYVKSSVFCIDFLFLSKCNGTRMERKLPSAFVLAPNGSHLSFVGEGRTGAESPMAHQKKRCRASLFSLEKTY